MINDTVNIGKGKKMIMDTNKYNSNFTICDTRKKRHNI